MVLGKPHNCPPQLHVRVVVVVMAVASSNVKVHAGGDARTIVVRHVRRHAAVNVKVHVKDVVMVDVRLDAPKVAETNAMILAPAHA